MHYMFVFFFFICGVLTCRTSVYASDASATHHVKHIGFGDDARFLMQWSLTQEEIAGAASSWFACAASGCVAVELEYTLDDAHDHSNHTTTTVATTQTFNGSRLVSLPLRASGDYLRILDDHFRTRQWVVWGHLTSPPLATDILVEIVRTCACETVWENGDTATSDGISWSSDESNTGWQLAPRVSTATCLADETPVSISDQSDPELSTDDTNWSALYLSASVTTSTSTHSAHTTPLVFARWLVSHNLACRLPFDSLGRVRRTQTQLLSLPTSSTVTIDDYLPGVWLSQEDADATDAFWKYARIREHSLCSDAEFQRQVKIVLACLGVSVLRAASSNGEGEGAAVAAGTASIARGWQMPRVSGTTTGQHGTTTTITNTTTTTHTEWRVTRRSDFERAWQATYHMTPIFLCHRSDTENPGATNAATASTNTLHSLVFVMSTSGDGTQHALRMRRASKSLSEFIAHELLLPDTITLCPPYFTVAQPN